MRVRSDLRLVRAVAVRLALLLGFALAGCSETPATLRIVSGPPQANEQIAALLASGSEDQTIKIWGNA